MRHAVPVLMLVLAPVLGLVPGCGEGTTPRPDDACDETRAQLLVQLERLIAEQTVAAGTPACGEGSIGSGMARFDELLPAASVEQITRYFASHCAALAGCE